MTARAAQAPPVVLCLDLDGTMYRGEAPLRAYAEAMAAVAEPALGRRLLRRAESFLARPESEAPYRDLWAALSAIGGQAGLGWPERDVAFVAVRERILAGEVPIERVPGLPAFVDGLAPEVTAVVLSNSDDESGRRLLAYLGLRGLVPRMMGGAGKPRGFAPALRTLLGRRDYAGGVSVGDNYANDVLAARDLGLATLHVRAPGAEGGGADRTVARLEDGFDWVRDQLERLVARRPPVQTLLADHAQPEGESP